MYFIFEKDNISAFSLEERTFAPCVVSVLCMLNTAFQEMVDYTLTGGRAGGVSPMLLTGNLSLERLKSFTQALDLGLCS